MLMAEFGIPQISTGDLLRDNIAAAAPNSAMLAEDLMEQGQLVPDDLVNEMVADRLAEPDVRRGYILDGFPRTLAQAEWLDSTHLQLRRLDASCRSASRRRDQHRRRLRPLLHRITGRRICSACKRIYNIYSNPPTIAGICDCGRLRLSTAPGRHRRGLREAHEDLGADGSGDRALPRPRPLPGDRRRAARRCRSTAAITAALKRSAQRQFQSATQPCLTMAILIKTAAEIEKMRRSGIALRQVHEPSARWSLPGASTMDLENVAAAKMAELGAISAFKGYHGFPPFSAPRSTTRWSTASLAEARPRRRRHRLRRLRRHHRRLLLRCRRDLRRRHSSAPATRKLLDVTQASLEAGHPAGPGRRPARRHLRRGPGDVRGRGLRRGPGVCRPRHRPIHARRPPGAQLRRRAARARG